MQLFLTGKLFMRPFNVIYHFHIVNTTLFANFCFIHFLRCRPPIIFEMPTSASGRIKCTHSNWLYTKPVTTQSNTRCFRQASISYYLYRVAPQSMAGSFHLRTHANGLAKGNKK